MFSDDETEKLRRQIGGIDTNTDMNTGRGWSCNSWLKAMNDTGYDVQGR